MDRRTVLATAASSLPILSVSGCIGAAPTNNSSAPSADTKPDNESRNEGDQTDSETAIIREPIELEVYNDTSSEVVATVTLIRGSSTVLENEFRIPGGDSTSTDTGITETGQYELSVDLSDGREKTWSFSIEAFDLRAGSNMFVAIEPDELEWTIEE